MMTAGILLFGLALIVSTVTGLMVVIAAFRESPGWGLFSLFVPFGILFFVAEHWDRVGKLFVIYLSTIPAFLIGGALMVFSEPMTAGFPPNADNTPARSIADASDSGWPAVPAQQPFTESPENSVPPSVEQDEPAPVDAILPGDPYQPQQSLGELPLVHYVEQEFVLSEQRGAAFGAEIYDCAPAGGLLVGLRIGVDEPQQRILHVRPIYQVGEQCLYGNRLGPAGGSPEEIVARSGYAIGGLLVYTGPSVRSIQAIFLQVAPDGSLQPNNRYYSDIIGYEFGRCRRLFAEQRPVIGISARSEQDLGSVGLCAVERSAQPPADGVAAASRPAPAQPTAEAPAGNAPPAAQSPPTTTAPSEPPPLRNWSSANGNFSVTARLQSFDGQTVVLEDDRGRTVRVAIDKLSAADQAFVRGQSKQ